MRTATATATARQARKPARTRRPKQTAGSSARPSTSASTSASASAATPPAIHPSRTSAQDRQASLIGAAATLFAARGFNGTTTKDIAKAAGVSEALLFKHFPTKRALYAAILTEKAHYGALRQAVDAASRAGDDRQLFTLLASFRIRKGADPTMLRLLLYSALEGHKMAQMFFHAQYRTFHDLLANYIRSRVEAGIFRPLDPLLTARAFFGIIVHHRLLHDILAMPLHRPHDEVVREYVDLFLAGLQASPREVRP